MGARQLEVRVFESGFLALACAADDETHHGFSFHVDGRVEDLFLPDSETGKVDVSDLLGGKTEEDGFPAIEGGCVEVSNHALTVEKVSHFATGWIDAHPDAGCGRGGLSIEPVGLNEAREQRLIHAAEAKLDLKHDVSLMGGNVGFYYSGNVEVVGSESHRLHIHGELVAVVGW